MFNLYFMLLFIFLSFYWWFGLYLNIQYYKTPYLTEDDMLKAIKRAIIGIPYYLIREFVKRFNKKEKDIEIYNKTMDEYIHWLEKHKESKNNK